ncbi:uncharacterized protein LOC132724731 [Ruditapes philippinarum]|uniref:uncharacterized protein LOC132724731 n=1 Tax=Ruditapes philippinarum TaxID=129788 RepID=UPI00295BC180|nr:uncharacterized protein LOC132724731 [Ruditapes philippinarum]XP_060565659.1 uncharacterized protein LOC132724731 [Ruditapes philippinarum]
MLPKNWENSDKRRYRKFRSYNVFTRNCEHFASWCVVGAKESFQVKSLRKTIAKILSKGAGVGCKIARFIMRFLYNSADEIASTFNMNFLPGIVLGFTALVYLIYCIVITIKLLSKYKRCKLCKTCFKREVVTLWTHFGAFIATSGISYILVHFLLPMIKPTIAVIPVLLVIVLLSLAVQWGIGKVRRTLMSPYECEKVPVLTLSDLNVGSMITFTYFGFQHFAIVTEVHEETDDSTIGTIKFVHYGLKSLNIFRKRHVMEELIRVDLNKASKKLKMVDCKHLNSYPSHQVVQRVKQRVGETNWNAVSNRSDHLCFWALVKQEKELENSNTNAENTENIGETKTKHKSSLCTGQTEVHVREEVRLGDVVKYGGVNGIVVNLDDITQCDAQEFEMELMVYRNYYVIREKKTINLRQKRLSVKNYHPAHCCSMSDRVQRACEKENTKCNYWLEESFFESCILKNI